MAVAPAYFLFLQPFSAHLENCKGKKKSAANSKLCTIVVMVIRFADFFLVVQMVVVVSSSPIALQLISGYKIQFSMA